MKYLMEHEVAFDVNNLGFPSVKGCLALVYQTNVGLYGFHATQCSMENARKNAFLFRNFIIGHSGGYQRIATGSRLYGITFVGERYAGNQHAEWRQEMGIFASALNFRGKISGYDLSKSFPGGNRSAYVLYTTNVDKCTVDIREWGAHEQTNAKVDNDDYIDHKIRKAQGGGLIVLAELPRVVPGIPAGALARIHKEKLS